MCGGGWVEKCGGGGVQSVIHAIVFPRVVGIGVQAVFVTYFLVFLSLFINL